jgi:Bacterial regulatory proteins, tetR family
MKTALAKSVHVFRERGYHATSIANLTEAMELASGSVYKAFKDKRAVFWPLSITKRRCVGKNCGRSLVRPSPAGIAYTLR